MEKKYEIVVVAINEEESKNLVSLIEKNVKIVDQTFVGQRVFAYPIKKNETGFYIHLLISAKVDDYNLIKKELDDSDACLRYLTFSSKRNDLKKDKEKERTRKPEMIEKASKEIKKIDEIEKPKVIEKKPDKVKVVKKITKATKPKKVEKITEKVKISELDKKLKKLLEE
ncbi:MAG: hypothetical protein UR93_C0018G0008 [Berkelbacteria bacterium GW2011_GWA2_35_9]|uniref:Small ribosomal subunit protein bS6 n=1 Tax=Berkelbacteria bacterium GW2011_GWA2_35_9 TaxID=1618333 RepID=A0A0G0D1Y0_9BACT|nr:MAG: hypothetical protein UR93_C0018G0008 [Berkelbacteria bacterium GW2011_GWA2_35_9]